MTVLVVGASLAGASVAATLRDEGYEGEIALVGAEPELPYERPPLSKGYLVGTTPREKLLVRPEGFWADHDVELVLGTPVVRVDATGRMVELAGGRLLAWSSLVIATGASPRRLRVPGAELAGVYDLRTLADSDRIRDEATPGRRAVVVGMGFIGAEAASTLRELGLEVVAVEPLSAPLERALGPLIGAAIGSLHAEHGVVAYYGEGVEAFEGDRRVERVVTSTGRRIECDFVVAGIGVAPEVGFLEGSGVVLDNGVVVDAHCRTTVAGVFAAGDVANHFHPLAGRHIRVEHWRNAIEQGAAAARSLLGKGQPYAEVHWFWSDQHGANIQYAGHHTGHEQIVVRGSLEERKLVAFYLDAGRVTAAVAIDSGRDLRRAQALIRAGVQVDPTRLADPEVDLRELS
jgi:3-phenylpropionate/trans-cinnamate dioxygenase ferredoxin reductase subunit